MKITILSPDLSNNCVARAYVLARVLQRRHTVEIAGPILGKALWKPLARDTHVPFHPIVPAGGLETYRQLSTFASEIDADALYVSKPLLTSLGVGMLATLRSQIPLILDIDDWEFGIAKDAFARQGPVQRARMLIRSALLPYSLDSVFNRYLGEKATGVADAITVSNEFLHTRFGGTIVYHGRDITTFDPAKSDPYVMRAQHAIRDTAKIVMFTGTPRPYKGLEDLVYAIRRMRDDDVVLLVLGIDRRDPYARALVRTARRLLGARFKGYGVQPFDSLPAWLSTADVVAIPQRLTPASVGQMPAKVFDAMAMAKPIVATNVSDLPLVLHNCGWIVPPGDPRALASALYDVLSHPEEARENGDRARKECICYYSWDALERALLPIFDACASQ